MYILIHVVSLTLANTAKSILYQKEIYTSVRKAPMDVSKTGCGYCIKLQENDLRRALAILEQNNIKILGVYKVGGDGIVGLVL